MGFAPIKSKGKCRNDCCVYFESPCYILSGVPCWGSQGLIVVSYTKAIPHHKMPPRADSARVENLGGQVQSSFSSSASPAIAAEAAAFSALM